VRDWTEGNSLVIEFCGADKAERGWVGKQSREQNEEVERGSAETRGGRKVEEWKMEMDGEGGRFR